MPVWFVYRSYDMGLTGKHLRRFEDDTVLGWFQRNWSYLAVEVRDEADRRLVEVLGCGGWPLFLPFCAAGENNDPPPQRIKGVLTLFRESFGDGEVRSDSAHVIQAFTEDDGEGGAVYFFDGRFLKKSGARAAYLLHEDWRLPTD